MVTVRLGCWDPRSNTQGEWQMNKLNTKQINKLYLPKAVLKDNRLTPATKLVAHYLFHISGWEDDNLLPSQKQLARVLSIEPKTIRTALNSLKENKYLTINIDNTFSFTLNGCSFAKKDLSNKQLCNMVGDFAIVPSYTLYCDLMTPKERDAFIKFFDFFFGIDDNKFYLKHTDIHISSVSTYYGDDDRSFRERIQHIREKGLLDYSSALNRDNEGGYSMKLLNVKVPLVTLEWVVHNGKSIQTEEKNVVETVDEESTEEQNSLVKELVLKLKPSQKREFELKISSSSIENQLYWLQKRTNLLDKKIS